MTICSIFHRQMRMTICQQFSQRRLSSSLFYSCFVFVFIFLFFLHWTIMFNYHTLQLVVFDQHTDPNMPRVFSWAVVRRNKKNAEKEEEWNELRELYWSNRTFLDFFFFFSLSFSLSLDLPLNTKKRRKATELFSSRHNGSFPCSCQHFFFSSSFLQLEGWWWFLHANMFACAQYAFFLFFF